MKDNGTAKFFQDFEVVRWYVEPTPYDIHLWQHPSAGGKVIYLGNGLSCCIG